MHFPPHLPHELVELAIEQHNVLEYNSEFAESTGAPGAITNIEEL